MVLPCNMGLVGVLLLLFHVLQMSAYFVGMGQSAQHLVGPLDAGEGTGLGLAQGMGMWGRGRRRRLGGFFGSGRATRLASTRERVHISRTDRVSGQAAAALESSGGERH
jgi:hypothetical protein